MDTALLIPPVAFFVYLALVAILDKAGHWMAGPGKPSSAKSSLYAGGEAMPRTSAAPGYRPFFVIALFFAILHLGVLMLGSGGLNWTSGLYLAGLLVSLIALILG